MTQYAICSLHLMFLLLKEYFPVTLQSYRNLYVTLVVSAFFFVYGVFTVSDWVKNVLQKKIASSSPLICINSQFGEALQSKKETRPESVPWEQVLCSPAANKHPGRGTKLELVWKESCWSTYSVGVGLSIPRVLSSGSSVLSSLAC